jgi:hypothetical protein
MPIEKKPDFTFGLACALATLRRPSASPGEVAGVLLATGLRWCILVWGGWHLAHMGPDGPWILLFFGLVVAAAIVWDLRRGTDHAKGEHANESSTPPE